MRKGGLRYICQSVKMLLAMVSFQHGKVELLFYIQVCLVSHYPCILLLAFKIAVNPESSCRFPDWLKDGKLWNSLDEQIQLDLSQVRLDFKKVVYTDCFFRGPPLVYS